MTRTPEGKGRAPAGFGRHPPSQPSGAILQQPLRHGKGGAGTASEQIRRACDTLHPPRQTDGRRLTRLDETPNHAAASAIELLCPRCAGRGIRSPGWPAVPSPGGAARHGGGDLPVAWGHRQSRPPWAHCPQRGPALYQPGGLEVRGADPVHQVMTGPRAGADDARPEHRDGPWRFAVVDIRRVSRPRSLSLAPHQPGL